MSLLFIFVSIFLFILGTVVGSFLNVIIMRSITGQQWVKGRSVCDFCHKPLKWYDMFPLLSFVFHKGKSRCCGKNLSISHPVIEFLTGTLFVWWYWGGALFFQLTRAPFSLIQPAFWLFVGLLLIIIFFIDLYEMVIFDWSVSVLGFLAFFYRVALVMTGIMQEADFFNALVMGLVIMLFYWVLWFVTRGRGMGFGDVKLSFPLVLLLGAQQALVATFMSFVIGAIVGLGLIMGGKKKFGQHLPFGPFMIIGTLIGLVWGDVLINWYVGLL